jgi:hypothetical protein
MVFAKFATRTLAYLYGERRQQISGLLSHLMEKRKKERSDECACLWAGPLLST